MASGTISQEITRTFSENIDIISKVDTFYNNAWGKLVLVGTAIFAVVGIIIPLAIQWYQKKTLELSESLLNKTIEDNIQVIKIELTTQLKGLINEKIQEQDTKILKLEFSMKGQAFHLQGIHCHETGNHKYALESWTKASLQYLACEDYGHLQTALSGLTKSLIAISMDDLDRLQKIDKLDLEALLSEVESSKMSEVFTKTCKHIRNILRDKK